MTDKLQVPPEQPEPSPAGADWLEELHGAPVEPYWPRTASDVEKALQWMGEAETEITAIQAQEKAAHEAIHARALAITAKATARFNGLRQRIEEWAKANREAVVHGKVKSRDFLAGTVGFRATQEKVVVIDEAAVLAWAQPDHLDLLRFPEPEIDKKKLDKFVLTTGEIPIGAEVKPAGETVTVKATPLPTLGMLDPKELKP